MSPGLDEAATQQFFLHRVLRILAVLGLLYGSLALLNAIVYFASFGWGRGRPWPSWVPLGRGISYSFYILAMASISALQIVGSWGLWRWCAWSRRVLIIWAAVAIMAGTVNTITYLISTVQALSATTQPTGISVPYVIWTMFASLLTSATLAVVTLLVMTQKSVADLWAPRGTSAFPVVPFAQAVVAHDSADSTIAS
jgi:hypothetical protein